MVDLDTAFEIAENNVVSSEIAYEMLEQARKDTKKITEFEKSDLRKLMNIVMPTALAFANLSGEKQELSVIFLENLKEMEALEQSDLTYIDLQGLEIAALDQHCEDCFDYLNWYAENKDIACFLWSYTQVDILSQRKMFYLNSEIKKDNGVFYEVHDEEVTPNYLDVTYHDGPRTQALDRMYEQEMTILDINGLLFTDCEEEYSLDDNVQQPKIIH